MTGPLVGSVAIVTGASSGIGAAIAETLAGSGVAVALVGRREDRLAALAEQIGAAGGVAIVAPGDISVASDAKAVIDAVVGQFGRLDILVNNAGVMLIGPIAEALIEEWERMVATNINGALYCTHAALPHLIAAAKSGRGIADIVNVSSVSGRKVIDNSAVYTATKMGLGGFSEGARAELARLGIRISLIEPGPTNSELLTHLRPPVFEELMRHIGEGPVFEPLAPQDVADAVAFVVSRSPKVAINEVMLRPTLSPF